MQGVGKVAISDQYLAIARKHTPIPPPFPAADTFRMQGCVPDIINRAKF